MLSVTILVFANKLIKFSSLFSIAFENILLNLTFISKFGDYVLVNSILIISFIIPHFSLIE